MRQFVESLLTGDVQRVSHVYRYSSRPVVIRENVAEHSYFVALYSLMIARKMGLPGMAYGKLLSRALVHDIDEGITGDFQRNFKYENEALRAELVAASSRVLERMLEPYGDDTKAWLVRLWNEAKAEDMEGDIVKTADFFAVVSYVIREHSLGNRMIDDILDEVIAYGTAIQSEVVYPTLTDIIEHALYLLKERVKNETKS